MKKIVPVLLLVAALAACGSKTTTTPPALDITTSSLAGGSVGKPYSQTLTVSGGVPPYTWSIATGALPPGLTLSPSGVISGTPTKSGDFSFTIEVQDSAQNSQRIAVSGHAGAI